MDDLSHVLFGILITLFFYSKDSRRRALIFCAVIGSLFPDIDIALRFFSEGLYLVEHRGFTHSILGMIILPLLLAYIFSLRYKGEFKKFYDVAFLSIVGHVLLDLPTSWGTMLLWPFSYHRYTLDWMFIVDPFLLFFLILGVAGYFITKKEVIIRIALLAIVLHYIFLAYMHHAVIDIAEKRITADKYAALPSFASPATWRIIATNETHYITGNYVLFPRHLEETQIYPRPSAEQLSQRNSVEVLEYFLRFSRFPYVVETNGVYEWKDVMFQGRDFLVVEVEKTSRGFHGKFR